MNDSDRILNDIRAYLRATAAVAARPNGVRVIDTKDKAFVFEELDGNTTQPRMEEVLGVSQPTISRWLAEFVREGLVTPPNEYYKNHKALYTLQELAIDVASLKKRARGQMVQPEPV